MKALSLWQPWATLMAIGAKKIETRSWNMRYRGPLAICATKTWNKKIVVMLTEANKEPWDKYPSDWKKIMNDLDYHGYHSLNELPLSAVLCVVDVVDCIPTEIISPPYSDFLSQITLKEKAFGDYSPGRYGIITENLRRLEEPIPIKGKQGIFDIPDFDYERVEE